MPDVLWLNIALAKVPCTRQSSKSEAQRVRVRGDGWRGRDSTCATSHAWRGLAQEVASWKVPALGKANVSKSEARHACQEEAAVRIISLALIHSRRPGCSHNVRHETAQKRTTNR